VSMLNRAYTTSHKQFEEIALPSVLPTTSAALNDWFDFEAVVLAKRRLAHRFRVLLPVSPSQAFDPAEHARRKLVASRIVAMEKPTHTIFEVRFYWAMFRIGEVRLGVDTVLDVGSRSPLLFPKMILDAGYLAESYLGLAYPQDVADRQLAGRDRLRTRPTASEVPR
jgi:hypothetical protein